MQEFESDKLNIETFKTHIKTQPGGNKSRTYILPMLMNDNFRYYTDFSNSNFRGVFIGDNTTSTIEDDKILLLYKFSGSLPSISFENKLIVHPLYEAHYEPDKVHTMYKFSVPDKLKEDYKLFKQWRPSKFSPEYKKDLLKFHRLDNSSMIYKVLNKDKKLKEEIELKIKSRIPEENELSSEPTWFIEYYQKDFNMKAPRDKMSPSKEFEL
jgi:hypothetical protein